MENEFPAPNCILRSSLFGVGKAGDRICTQGKYQELPGWGKWKVEWRGTQLDQADFDLWLVLVKKAFRLNSEVLNSHVDVFPNCKVCFKKKPLLRELKRSTGGRNVKWLDEGITRLRDCDIRVTFPCGLKKYSGRLLHDRYQDESTLEEVIELNTKLAMLFGRDAMTLVDLDQRLKLGKNSLAKWLHGFLSSHKGPLLPIYLSTIKSKSGSKTDLKVLRGRVCRALDTLTDRVRVYGVESKYKDGNLDYLFQIRLIPKRKRTKKAEGTAVTEGGYS